MYDKTKFASNPEEKYVTFESRRKKFDSMDKEFADSNKCFDSLAKTGFYSIEYGSLIQCYKCCVRLFNLSAEQKPEMIHALLSPTFPHLQTFENRNLLSLVSSVQQQRHLPR